MNRDCVKFSVVIITHNRVDLLKKTMTSIMDFAEACNGEVIVVDNASSDNTKSYLNNLTHKYSCLQIINNDKNLGIAPARNIGLEKVKGEIILSLDDDIIIENETLLNAISVFDKFPTAGIVAPLVLEHGTGIPLNGVIYTNKYDIKHVANHHGAFCIIRREALLKGGFLDEEGTFGGEERSLSTKIHIAGYDIIFDPSLVGYHIDTIDRSKPILYRFERRVFNNVRLNFKYLPIFFAALFSFRYIVTMIIIGRPLFPIGTVKLIIAAIKGMTRGLKQHLKMPVRTIKYYTSSKLRPQYGNKSLTSRVIKNLKSSLYN